MCAWAVGANASPSPGPSRRARTIVADEPVSMLDVSVRLGILRLLARLQREENLAVLYDIIVLYRGRVVERGPADEVILNPQHPYTQLLAAASPDPRRPRPLHGTVGRPRAVSPRAAFMASGRHRRRPSAVH
ncbi:hypothetical protein [Dactylosporangium sp. NPDC049140]|uniref:ABC transporter ATP-binding protein n=1 Tax=Dactylosporangium sp. NPDC049140 TaxID=3155647 RepID=UPI0033F420E7